LSGAAAEGEPAGLVARTWSAVERTAAGRVFLGHRAGTFAVLGDKTFTDAEGNERVWADDLAAKIVDLQSADGSWTNTESARWWESDPVLATSYAILALNECYPYLGSGGH
jgi:hypothetical protein